MHEYGFGLTENKCKDMIRLFCLNHKEYLPLDEAFYHSFVGHPQGNKSILSEGGILVNVKGILKGKIKDLGY